MFCPKCGANAGNANFCPKCGAKLPQPEQNYQHSNTSTYKSRWNKGPKKKPTPARIVAGTLSGIIIAVAIIAIFATLIDSGNSSSSSSSTSKIASSMVSPTKSVSYKEQNDGEVSIKINSVDEKTSLPAGILTEYTPNSGAKFIVANITVKNISREMYSFLVSNFQLYSSNGNKYSPSAMLTAQNYLNAGSINPSLSITGDVGIEVPESMKISDFTLKFQGLASSKSLNFKLK